MYTLVKYFPNYVIGDGKNKGKNYPFTIQTACYLTLFSATLYSVSRCSKLKTDTGMGIAYVRL